MKTLKAPLRLVGALVLIFLGAVILLFYRSEEFSSLIGIGSVIIGLGFLWRSWNKKE